MVTDRENREYNAGVRGMANILPVLRRNGYDETADRLEVTVAKIRTIFPNIRDVEMLNETGCCCGEIRGARTNRELCEACEQRAGNGGVL